MCPVCPNVPRKQKACPEIKKMPPKRRKNLKKEVLFICQSHREVGYLSLNIIRYDKYIHT